MLRAHATLRERGTSYSLSRDKTNKETAMQALALSTVLFQAIATVALVVGVAFGALFPGRRSQG
jgi:hypothetical protein